MLPAEGPYFIGQLIYFSCDEGYEIIGVLETQCTLERVWKDPFPVCVIPPGKLITIVRYVVCFRDVSLTGLPIRGSDGGRGSKFSKGLNLEALHGQLCKVSFRLA